MASTEREAQISPVVAESIAHNTKTLSNLQSLTASIFGAAAGILGLESYSGFLFYFIFTILNTILFYVVRVAPSTSSQTSSSTSATKPNASTGLFRYFRTRYEFWLGSLFGGLPGYILTWTLFYGLVRA